MFHNILRALYALFATREAIDPLSRMTPAELADLPVHHPRRDTGCPAA